MRLLYTLFITHVHLFVNNNLCVVKIRIICYDFNNELATLGIQYNVCTAAAAWVHVYVCGGAGAHFRYILQCLLKNIYNDQKLVYGSICNLW